MLKRGMLLSFILIVALFLFSCQSPVKTETTPETPAETAPSGCTAHWECADEDFKHYQAEDCSWGTPERCELGCVNNTCRSAEVCTPGFKCVDDFRRGYQKEDCSFLSKISCEWGCDAGKCQEKPTNIFTNASAPSKESEPIAEQGNFTYENLGMNFNIEWILFQSYAGGKQEIGYSVK